MNEAGLSTKWRLRFERDGNRCVGNDDADKNAKERRNNQRITLSNMSGSFVILLVGLLFSVTVFIVELIFRRRESPVNNHLQLPAQTHTNLINNNNGSIINTPPATLPVSSDQLNQSFVVDLPVPNTLKADSDKVINNKVAKQQYPKTVRNKSDNNKDSIEHLNEPDSESSNYDINNSLRPAKIFERKSSPIVAIDSLPQESNKELLAITINNNTPIGNDLQISAKEEDTVNNSKERMSMK